MNNKIHPLSLVVLSNLSSSRSFHNGQDYYDNGCVGKITQNNGVFTAAVEGSHRYKVTMKLVEKEPHFHCTCPYDYGGICKHSVALGLAVLDGDFAIEVPVSDEVVGAVGEFDKYFSSVNTEKKIAFLEQLLGRDGDFRAQFIAFTKEESFSKKVDDIDSLREEIFDCLSEIDLNAIGEDFDPYRDGYYHDDYGYDDAIDTINEVFEPYKAKAQKSIRLGNIPEAVATMLAMYEATIGLPDVDDEYDVLGDSYYIYVQDELSSIISELSASINGVVSSESVIISAIDVFAERITSKRFRYNENSDGNVEESQSVNLKILNPLLQSLVTNASTANHLYQTITKAQLVCNALAKPILRIAEVINNEILWVDTAEKFSLFNETIAMQLVQHYKSHNQLDDFNRIARKVFAKWPNSFDEYLLGNLDKTAEPELYIQVLKSYTKSNQSVKHYKELREYLSEEERKSFIESVGSSFDYTFHAKLLDVEGWHHIILEQIKKDSGYGYSFDSVIKLILNKYPDECFDILKDRCQEAMSGFKRNRDTYQRIAGWLKMMKSIQSKKDEADKYILQLFNHKPNLPALKDELKKAGLC